MAVFAVPWIKRGGGERVTEERGRPEKKNVRVEHPYGSEQRTA